MTRKPRFNARLAGLIVAALALLAPAVAMAQASGFETATTTSVPPAGADFRAPVRTLPVEAVKSLAALNDTVTVLAAGLNTGVIRLPPGSWTGTIVAEGSADGTFADALSLNVLTYGPGATSQASMTAPGTYEVTITGLAAVRVRAATAITSGPVSVLVRAAVGNKSIRVGAPAGNPVPVTSTPASGTLTDTSATQQSLSGLTAIEARAADTTSLGQWFLQNQSATALVIVLCNDAGVTTPCASRAGTFLAAPGGAAAQGGSLGWQDVGAWKGRIDIYANAAAAQHTLTRQ